jgi:hypothetical protein
LWKNKFDGYFSKLALRSISIPTHFQHETLPKNLYQMAPVLNKYGKLTKIICFDDLGIETSIKHFGNECNTMGEILLSRYELMKYDGVITHATTNLNADDLEKLYGNRVRSRLREMFNVISFPESTSDKRQTQVNPDTRWCNLSLFPATYKQKNKGES